MRCWHRLLQMIRVQSIKGMVSPVTGLLCLLSALGGVTLGLRISAWGSFASTDSVLTTDQPFSQSSRAVEPSVPQPFFPELELVETAVTAAALRSTIRADQLRQQKLEQTIDVLQFHGSTSEDIAEHVKRQIVKEQKSHSTDVKLQQYQNHGQ